MRFPFPVREDIPLYLAPMAGVSESPFRRLCRRFGADVVVTEFLSAEGIRRENAATLDKLRFGPDDFRRKSLDGLGNLSAGGEKTIRRNGQAMNLNNDGDTITLLNPAGTMVQSVTYPAPDASGEMTVSFTLLSYQYKG